jgi:hypothetical protein
MIFRDFDFGVLDSPNYKEDAVREDIVAPFLKALGYQPSGEQRMERSKALTHPFVMIGSQKRKINIVPDYTLFQGDQPILVLDAKRPSEPIVKSEHVEQAFSYAIHPDIRTRSYALCNGHELVLYDVEKSEPVLQVRMDSLGENWNLVLRHLSPVALANHHHRSFLPDLGIFLKNAGFTSSQQITFPNSRIQMLGHTIGGGLTACAAHEILEGEPFQGSFDMPMKVLPALLSCLPEEAARPTTKALQSTGAHVWVGGVIEVNWTFELGHEQTGLYEHDPLIPLVVRVIRGVARAESLGVPPDGLPPEILNLQSLLNFL